MTRWRSKSCTAGVRAYTRAGTHARPASGRALWQCGRDLSGVADGTGSDRTARGLCAGLGTGKSLELAQEELEKAKTTGAKIVTSDNPAYPARLKQIYDPPPVLYLRGEVSALSEPGIAVVGTRHPSRYGSGMAECLAVNLSARGLVILSRMARGVGTAAHRGAIASKGKTVAVFGTGVDVLYPKENTRLAAR